MLPDFRAYIPPMQLRRMSRLLSMGIYAGLDCLSKAGIALPDGIITGTGKGSMTDTEKFVKELSLYQEEALNPTPFILSTYNAVNGALALNTTATGYNQTFVHRGSSLEWSLYDAQLKLQDTDTRHLLVGSFDELTPEYYFIKSKIGYWKNNFDPGRSLYEQADTPGTIGGEGTAFFLLGKQKAESRLSLLQVSTAYEPEQPLSFVAEALAQRGLGWNDIGLLVLGCNGDRTDQPAYDAVMTKSAGIPILCFKHLSGEYETSGSFALWLLYQWSRGVRPPDSVWRGQQGPQQMPEKILYYNHYRGINHNVILLEADAGG